MSLAIYIEGNIGVGKSTLLRRLQATYEDHNCLVLNEPIADWPSLKLFYEVDRRAYTYPLQCEIIESFHKRETTCPIRPMYIFERSIKSSYEIFATLNCTPEELEKLGAMVRRSGRATLFPAMHNVYIYLKAPATTCLQRIATRQKGSDSSITLEYLQQLEAQHEKFFQGKDCTVVNADRDDREVAKDVCTIIDDIRMKFNV